MRRSASAVVSLLLLAGLAGGAENPERHTRFLDDFKAMNGEINLVFVGDSITEPKDIMPDAPHPNARGYEVWAEAIRPTLQKMMAGK